MKRLRTGGKWGLLAAAVAAIGLLLLGCVCARCGRSRDASNSIPEGPLTTGAVVPPVSLRTVEGATFDLQASLAEQPAVLIFYRGGWCPYCTLHLAALQEIEPQVLEAGYRILAISPDRPEKLAESHAEHELNYQLLSDSDMRAARAFGLAFKVDDETLDLYQEYGIDIAAASGRDHHELPVPGVFVVDRQGIQFAFTDPDYTVRLEPKALLRVLAKTGTQ